MASVFHCLMRAKQHGFDFRRKAVYLGKQLLFFRGIYLGRDCFHLLSPDFILTLLQLLDGAAGEFVAAFVFGVSGVAFDPVEGVGAHLQKGV